MAAVEVLPMPQTDYFYDTGSESVPSEQHDDIALDLVDDDDQEMSAKKREEYPTGYFPPTPPQDEKPLSPVASSDTASTTALPTHIKSEQQESELIAIPASAVASGAPLMSGPLETVLQQD